jgi:hypothetical protein
MLLAMILTSAMCVILFFYPDPFHQLASLATQIPDAQLPNGER